MTTDHQKHQAGARAVAERMGQAATNLLASLARDQRARTVLDFADQAKRTSWYYTPTARDGLPLAEMDRRQQRLAHALVATGLSRAGYVTASTIMGLETTLDEIEGTDRRTRMWFGRPNRDGNGNIFLVSRRDKSGVWRVGFFSISIGSQSIGGAKYDFMNQMEDAREWSPGCEGGFANEWAYVQRFENGTASAVVLWKLETESKRTIYVSSYMAGTEDDIMRFIHSEGYGNTGT